MTGKHVRMWMTFLIVLSTTGNSVFADLSLIAGSSNVSPPPFSENSYWPILPSVQKAFPFTVVSGGPYLVEELEVAAWHHDFLDGSSAYFSINDNNRGKPGSVIATTLMTGITTSPQIVSATFTEEVILSSDTLYWLVGRVHHEDVSWCLGSTFGPAAYREDQGSWVVLPHTNVCAYAILGSPVPEPATLLLLGLGGLFFRRRR